MNTVTSEEKKPVPSILKLAVRTVVPATTGKFLAKEKFVINTQRNGAVMISQINDNFQAWFLDGSGKTEDPGPARMLCCHTLVRNELVDGLIISELGGEVKVEVALSEMFSLLERQMNGEDGVLLNYGFHNIFYVKDVSGLLRVVLALWGSISNDGWRIIAAPLNLHVWGYGTPVFSGQPVPSALESWVPA